MANPQKENFMKIKSQLLLVAGKNMERGDFG